MLNHAYNTEGLRIQSLVTTLPNVSSARLLAGLTSAVVKKVNFELPFPVIDQTGKEFIFFVGQGAEGPAALMALIEELGKRIDHAA